MIRFPQLLPSLLAAAFSCQAQAQIPVSKEPRHHNVFENDRVRILDVHIPPGDTSLMHTHSTPSVFLVLSNTKTGSQAIVEPGKMHLTEGNIWFEGFYDKPRIHRVWNSDTLEFHVMDIELVGRPYREIDSALKQAPFRLLFDERPVRAYLLTLDPGTNIGLPGRKAAVLVIGLKDAVQGVTVNEKSFGKKGDFLFIPAGDKISLANKGDSAEELAFLEIK